MCVVFFCRCSDSADRSHMEYSFQFLPLQPVDKSVDINNNMRMAAGAGGDASSHADTTEGTSAALHASDLTPLPPLDAPVPADWESAEGTYSLVYACFVSHLGQDMHFSRHASLADDVIYLNVVSGAVGRSQLLKLCLAMAPGRVHDLPFVEVRLEAGLRQLGGVFGFHWSRRECLELRRS